MAFTDSRRSLYEADIQQQGSEADKGDGVDDNAGTSASGLQEVARFNQTVQERLTCASRLTATIKIYSVANCCITSLHAMPVNALVRNSA